MSTRGPSRKHTIPTGEDAAVRRSGRLAASPAAPEAVDTGQNSRNYSVAEAKNHLSDLINRSLAGEPVVITRHGHPVVELRAVQRPGRRTTAEDTDWLAAHCVDMNSTVDAGTLLSRMRDEEER